MKVLFLPNLADPSLGGGGEVTLWALIRVLQNIEFKCVLLATSSWAGLVRTERTDTTNWLANIRNVY